MRSSLTRAEPSRRRPFTRGRRRSSLSSKRWGSGTRSGWGLGLEPGWYVQVRSQQSAFNELRSSKAAVALSSISSIEQQVLVSYKSLNAVFVAHRHPLLIYSPVQHRAACHHGSPSIYRYSPPSQPASATLKAHKIFIEINFVLVLRLREPKSWRMRSQSCKQAWASCPASWALSRCTQKLNAITITIIITVAININIVITAGGETEGAGACCVSPTGDWGDEGNQQCGEPGDNDHDHDERLHHLDFLSVCR